eukprot:XP_011674437.1 PREDICTED: cystine/glutamate transporter-like [Strongylocentrotus purpuratus]
MARLRKTPGKGHQNESVQDLTDSTAVRLTRQVTLIDSVSLTVGMIIGSGIFISPTSVLENSGGIGWALLVWVLCGILSMLGALCYAELGTTFPVSGGDFSYLLEAYGPVLAFLRLWTSVVSIKTASLSVPLSRSLELSFTVAKLFGLAVIIVSGFVQLANGKDKRSETSNFANAFDTSKFSMRTFPLAMYSGLFAYSGWQYLTQVTEEIVNPSRTIPLSIGISMIIVTVVYLLTNIAYFTVLSEREMLTSSAVALDFGQRVLGSWWWTMSVAVAMSTVGSVHGGVFGFVR